MASKKKQPKKDSAELPSTIRHEIKEMAKNFKPRPVQRIPEILDELKKLWLLSPEEKASATFGESRVY